MAEIQYPWGEVLMAVIKDVTGAVMPWVVLAGIAVVVYKYRDQIIGWITGGAGDVGQTVSDWFTGLFGGPEPYVPYHEFTATPEERQANILAIPGLVFAPPEWTPGYQADEAPAPEPSALAVALGLTGDPVSGYSSVMAPLSATPPPLPGNTYQAFAHLDVNPDPQGYDLCKGDICLNLRPYAWNIDRVIGGQFAGNIAAAGGSDPAVWAQLRNYIGMVT